MTINEETKKKKVSCYIYVVIPRPKHYTNDCLDKCVYSNMLV